MVVKSPYLYTIELPEGNTLAAHFATGAIALLNKQESMDLSREEDADGAFEALDFLTSSVRDERRDVQRRHRVACKKPAVLNLTLLPTLACDLACKYCFEERPLPHSMSDEIANAVVALAREQVSGHLRLDVSWFGGEPLLAIDRIVELHPQLQRVAEESGCEFTSNLTTNGYRLDRDNARVLQGLGIRQLQITVDGNRSFHNRHRPTKSGQGTFDQIMTNLATWFEECPESSVVLRVNGSADSIPSIIEVLSEMPESVRHHLAVHLQPVLSRCDLKGMGRTFVEAARTTYQLVRGLGGAAAVDQYLDPSQAVFCYAERVSSVVVDPRGWIYKCALCGYDEDERVGILEPDGHVRPTGAFVTRWEEQCALEPTTCRTCQYLPICGYGCPRLRTSEHNTAECMNRFSFLSDSITALTATTRKENLT